MKFLAGFLAAVVFSTAALAQSEARLAWSTSSLTLDTKSAGACAPTVVENFVRYAVVRLDERPAPAYALLVQRFDVGSGCFEGFNPARADVYAKPVDIRTGKVGEKALWSLVTEGISGEVVPYPGGALYRVDMPGCCGAAKTEKYFGARTGKLVASSTGPLLSLESSKDRAVRFVAVESSIASSPQGPAGAMATVYFGDADEAREVLTIGADAKAEPRGWAAEIAWKGKEAGAANLLVPDFSAEASLSLVLHCLCDAPPVRIEIPVSGDGLDERGALVEGMPGIVLTKTRVGATTHRAVAPATPAAVVQAFFDYLLKPKTNIATDATAQRRWLAADLRKQLMETAAAVKEARKLAEGPDPAVPGNGVFLDSWDYPSQCRVSEARAPEGARAEVTVQCEWGWRTNYAGVARTALVSVASEGGIWRVSGIHMRKNKYSGDTDLERELASLKRQADELLNPPAAPAE